MVIAAKICEEWPVEETEGEEETEKEDGKVRVERKVSVEPKDKMVRDKALTHTVIFFIDYQHAQPHEADIHVLLRTCLNPHRGVHLILNERTAIDWGETIRPPHGCFAK